MSLTIDLRSDTVTKPSEEMRRVMAEAPVGDDVFGDDPTVHKLEGTVADLLGKEAAVFVPSGTMANQVALASLANHGDEILLHEHAHILDHEGGAAARHSGLQLRTIRDASGRLPLGQVREQLSASRHRNTPQTLVCVENTHGSAGGTVYPLDELRELSNEVHARGLKMHMDGARLWNAAVASGVAERDYAACTDVVGVCFSKGLGAPVGSAICSTREIIAKARKLRSVWGGSMRQAGIVAAGALFALQNNRARLAEDHRRASLLAQAIGSLPDAQIPHEVKTNIIMFGWTNSHVDADRLVEACESEGLRFFSMHSRCVRLVTNMHVTDTDIAQAIEIISKQYKTLS